MVVVLLGRVETSQFQLHHGDHRLLKCAKENLRYRLFVYAQWCGGVVLIAMPFYVVQASESGFNLERVALLLGAQTTGALVSNFLWGWWGDKVGKGSLMRGIAISRILPPAAIVLFTTTNLVNEEVALYAFIGIFFILGALANGLTIAVIGFLMEISPDDMRPAYSGYFNAITAPAFLLPLFAGILARLTGLLTVFIISIAGALLQSLFMVRVGKQKEVAHV